jgi:hypothetical protein
MTKQPNASLETVSCDKTHDVLSCFILEVKILNWLQVSYVFYLFVVFLTTLSILESIASTISELERMRCAGSQNLIWYTVSERLKKP